MISAIFSINPGRSGSHYLSELLSHTENCESHHEYPPTGFGAPLVALQRGAPAQMEAVAKAQLARIADAKQRGKIYADSTHNFIKGFADLLAPDLPEEEIGIVILRREKAKVVNSHARVYCLPLTPTGRRYILTPEKKNPVVAPPSFFGLPGRFGYYPAWAIRYIIAGLARTYRKITGQETQDRYLIDYQKESIGWYVDETYTMGERFQQKYPKCTYVEMTIDDLNNPEKVADMFKKFGLKPKPSLWDAVGKSTNKKEEHT